MQPRERVVGGHPRPSLMGYYHAMSRGLGIVVVGSLLAIPAVLLVPAGNGWAVGAVLVGAFAVAYLIDKLHAD